MKTYPLEIREITDLGTEELLGVYSKGHHAAGSEVAGDPFLTAARAHLLDQQGWDADELDEVIEAIGISFETWRCVPTRSWGDWVVMFAKAEPGSRGSFPVTVCGSMGEGGDGRDQTDCREPLHRVRAAVGSGWRRIAELECELWRRGRPVRFLLGAHQPHWLGLVDVPLMVSHHTLRHRRGLPRALGPWALDSGAFSEIAAHGRFTTSPRVYAAAVRRYADEIGHLDWAAIQDWMCERFMLRRTGLTIPQHQAKTIASLLDLRTLAPDLPWLPVLQGFDLDDYLLRTTRAALGRPRARGLVLGSCGPGIAVVWLDAVLAQQALQALDLTVQPLVLLDHRRNVHVGHPLPLPPRPVGKQLPFPVAQRRSPVEFLRVDRGLLLPPHLGDLLLKLAQILGHGHADQPRPRTCLLALAGQQPHHLLADPGVVGAEPGQHLRAHALALAADPQQEVLGAHVVVTKLQRLAQRQLQCLLGPGRERDMPGRAALALADTLFDLDTAGLQRDAQRLQRLGGHAFALAEQAEQKVLGAEVVVVEEPGFLLGQDDHPPGLVGEPLEHPALQFRRGRAATAGSWCHPDASAPWSRYHRRVGGSGSASLGDLTHSDVVFVGHGAVSNQARRPGKQPEQALLVRSTHRRHVDAYSRAGVDLGAEPLFGIGSVCRRQATAEIDRIVTTLASQGLRLHGFGVKTAGLSRYGWALHSADSLAWSYSARRQPPLPGHRHKNCANCLEYALCWRQRVVRQPLGHEQLTLEMAA